MDTIIFNLDTIIFIVVIMLMNDRIADKFHTYTIPRISYKVLLYVYVLIMVIAVLLSLFITKNSIIFNKKQLLYGGVIGIILLIELFKGKD